MVRNYQRKTAARPADRNISVICDDRPKVDTASIAEVLIRISLKNVDSDDATTTGSQGLGHFLQDTFRAPQ